MSINTVPLAEAVIRLQKEAKGLSVLYVEDDLNIQKAYINFLERFFENIEYCNNGLEGVEAATKKKFDLIISDIEMPYLNGIEMVQKIKQVFPTQKVILVSAHKDSEVLHQSISLQVDGYLFKPLDRAVAIDLLYKIVSIINTENENRKYKECLEKIVEEKTQELISSFTIDKVTQFYSLAKLQQEDFDTMNRALAIVKVRKFKSINDFYGYASGDFILQQIAQFLRTELQEKYREYEIEFYRVSGSHFVISSSSNVQKLYELIDEIQHLFESTKMDITEEHVLLEMDAAVLSKNTKPSLSNLDKALRRAEELNRIILYENDEKEELNYKKRIQCKNKLIKAYEENRIINYYQPIIDNNNGTIYKYEALVRMVSEDGEVISPGIFLPVAKETKMYALITKSVFLSALRDFRDSECMVSINLSLEDIKNKELRYLIRESLIQFPQPSRIVFEILESDEIDSYAVLVEFIQEMHTLGAKVAIDDFGSGYSNFEHLAHLYVDYIKIDGSLIKDIHTNHYSQAVVQMLYDFASKMNIKTIAEFVSKAEISSYINAIGIDESQGYFFSEPLPFQDSMKRIYKITEDKI
ncbi:EAL domain-containing response regulator [Sulfurimonas marina]|uniref:EAL domain-containing protein n=1 Tax=Sulfurimonas marina TaxID=2590551 RepID=A0A7M3V9D9_9BACT|nr:EAL domain-containing protein [Sulfurimonas marina]QOP40372.1 EAL domain-containing protein [Sulfurimonas marina]